MKKALILAGGEGKRLRPYTFIIPKPLMPIGEKPIIGIVLDRLIKSDFKEVIITVGYMGDMLINVVNSLVLPISISYVKETHPLGTAGSLGLLNSFDDDLLVINGDLLTNMNFNNLYNFHRENKAIATLSVFRRELKIDFGVIKMDDKRNFKKYIEKPTYGFDVSMGINVFSPEVREYIKKDKYLDIPNLIKKINDHHGKIICYKEDCKWLDIGREYDYRLATEEFDGNDEEYL